MHNGLRHLAALMLALVALVALVATVAGAAGRRDIDAAVDAIHAHAGAHRLVLLGEFHGTREIPLLVADLASRYAGEGPVVLALEIPRTEQAALDRALAASTPAAARAMLLARPWWRPADIQHDGRRSRDMLDLIERMRRLRAQGRDVSLLAYDVPSDASTAVPDSRDRAMADALRAAYAALPRGRLLMLGGNVHAMLQRPVDAPAQLPVPAGSHLRDLDPVAVRIMAKGGESWICPAPRRCLAAATGNAGASTGPMTDEYTYAVALDRFSVARLLGDGR